MGVADGVPDAGEAAVDEGVAQLAEDPGRGSRVAEDGRPDLPGSRGQELRDKEDEEEPELTEEEILEEIRRQEELEQQEEQESEENNNHTNPQNQNHENI